MLVAFADFITKTDMMRWYLGTEEIGSTWKVSPVFFFFFPVQTFYHVPKKLQCLRPPPTKNIIGQPTLNWPFLFLPFLGKDKSVEWHNTGYRKMPQKTNLYQSIILLYFALFLSSWTEPLIWAYIIPAMSHYNRHFCIKPQLKFLSFIELIDQDPCGLGGKMVEFPQISMAPSYSAPYCYFLSKGIPVCFSEFCGLFFKSPDFYLFFDGCLSSTKHHTFT